MLPELPDILAELSKLYKLQGELKDYLEINEQLVERLVNHQRFDEAWAVSEATAKINMDSANKQVNLIESRFKKFSNFLLLGEKIRIYCYTSTLWLVEIDELRMIS